MAEVVEVRFSLVRNQSYVGKRFIAKFNLGVASFMFIFSRDEGISRGPWLPGGIYQGKLALLYNLVGPGTTMSWWTKYLIIRVGYSPAEELVVI